MRALGDAGQHDVHDHDAAHHHEHRHDADGHPEHGAGDLVPGFHDGIGGVDAKSVVLAVRNVAASAEQSAGFDPPAPSSAPHPRPEH